MTGSYLTKPQQHLDELRDFIGFLQSKAIGSFLEIGSKFGGVLWEVAKIMPKGSRLVSVDLPNGPWGRSESMPSLQACIAHLKRDGYDAHLFLADSTDANVVSRVRALSPFDAVFIDANHTEPYVRKDFANYGKMAKIVCFHDIGWRRAIPPGRMAIEVPKVWAEIKMKHLNDATFREIRFDPTAQDNGIGIMQWR